jgi:antitoxin CptB
VRLSAFRLPLSFRGRFTEPTIHAKGFAGGDDACPKKERMNTRITGLTIMTANVISTPPGTSGLLALDWKRQMTGSTRSSDGLDDRRKRLLFRCWHRGTREMDLILGRFADAAIADLSDAELEQLEQLIEVPDPDLYAALSSDVLLAPEYRNRLFDRIKSFPADRDV